MSKQTQRDGRWRGDPSVDADLEAPTAPHAQPRVGKPKKLSGPAKFWSPRPVRIALIFAIIASVAFHFWVSPWNFLPNSSGVSFDEPDGDLAIPVDLIGEDPPPAPPEPPPKPVDTAETPKADDPNAPGKLDAGPPKTKDAGIPLAIQIDAGIADGGADAAEISDASITDASDDSGLYAMNDDGGTPGANGPRDPEAMFGLTKVVNAGAQNIVLGINVALIRQHPVGGRMGPVLKVIHQWRDFLKDSPIDPIKDTDWILIYGPSLRNTDKDAVLVRYNTTDKIVDETIANIAKASVNGGKFDAGVSGVPGSIGRADNGDRVFIRPQPKLLVIVPPSHAHESAVVFKKQTPRGPPPKEAVRLVMKNPSNEIKIPKLKFQQGVTEIRMWIIPQETGGDADLYFEGDCVDEVTAQNSADGLTDLLRDLNGIGVRIATHGLINGAKVTADGKQIKMHHVITQDQLEALLQIAAAQFGVNVAPLPTPATSGSAKPNFQRQNE